MNKKIITLGSFIIASTMLLSSCKGKTVDKYKAGDKSPITLSYFALDKSAQVTFEDEIAAEITKATGVTIDYQTSVDGGDSMIALMIASGEYPDMMFAKGATSQLIDSGAFIRLDDPENNYIERSENIKNFYGDKINRLKYTLDNPGIYALSDSGPGGEMWDCSSYFYIQNAALKELGYPKIENIHQFEDAIVKYYENHPEIDGQPTIPITLNMDNSSWVVSLGNPSGFALGYPDDGQWAIDQNTYKVTYKFELPEMREFYRWVNGLYNKGLIDKDSFTQKADAYRAKLATGRVIATFDGSWDFGDSQKVLINEGKDERTFFPLPVVMDETKYKDATTTPRSYICGSYGTGVTISCKNPDRAVAFLDYVCSDEFQVLNSWGIENKHYTIDANGKRVQNPEIAEKRVKDPNFQMDTGIGLHGWPLPTKAGTLKDSSGNYYGVNTPESSIENYSDAKKETLKGYGVTKVMDLFPQPSEFKETAYGAAWMASFEDGSEEAVIFKKANDYSALMLPKAVMASPDQFDKVWDEFMKGLKETKIEQADEAFTKLVSDRVKLWNE